MIQKLLEIQQEEFCNMNIFDEIYKNSKNSKKKIFLNQNHFYSDLYNLTNEYYSFFKLNLIKGEVINVILPYSLDFVAIILAARLNKNVLCIINPNHTGFEKNSILDQSNYSMILSQKPILSINKKFKNIFYRLKKSNFKLQLKDAFIVFTSGTTSKPKGAILTDNSIKNNVKGIISQLNFNTKDRTIIYSPPNYAMGISQVITFLYLKSSFIFDNEGIKFSSNFLSKIKKYKITILNLNVASFRYLKIFKKKYKLPHLKTIMGGGMKMKVSDATEIFNFFQNKYLVNFYGCTENSPRVSHLMITKSQLKEYKNNEMLPVGKPLRGTKIFIRSKNNDINKKGEIILKGNSLMRGYLNSKKKPIKIKEYRTKDIGFLTSNKNLYLIGRLDNIFKSGNEKISPEEIEDKIAPFIKNKSFIVIKKKHEILNWQPVLVIEGKKNISDQNLLTKIDKNLSNFKMPKEIYYLKNFFRNNYGKIDRNKIYNHFTKYVN